MTASDSLSERMLDGPDPIREVTCFSCSVPLPRPLSVGAATVTRRTYDVVRIRTESGLDGAAYAFSRGLPIARIVEDALEPLLLDADARMPELVRKRLNDAHWPYGSEACSRSPRAPSISRSGICSGSASASRSPTSSAAGAPRSRSAPSAATGAGRPSTSPRSRTR